MRGDGFHSYVRLFYHWTYDMKVTASELRQDIYRILDAVIETGVPVEIERHGKILRIVPPEAGSRISRLPQRDYLNAEPDEIVHLDWSGEWKP